MSLYGTMRTGVSGMNAQSNRLSTVAENIANANTTGYKRASTEFSSMILPSGNGSYNSGGVQTEVRYSISQQGATTFTTSASDLAIDGGGFFIVEGANGQEYLTRAGSFVPDSEGNLVNASGFTLMGYEYEAGVDPTVVVNGFDGLTRVNLASDGLIATGSTKGSMGANLPSGAAVGDVSTTSLVVYDSQGNTRILDFNYEKTGANAWSVEVVDRTSSTVLGTQTLNFNADGSLTATPATLTTSAMTALPGTGANLSALTIDLTKTTQLGYAFNADGGNIDGNAPSKVAGYQIDSDGIVYVKYENGKLDPRYRIALANVQSPDKLKPESGNVYSQGVDSGVIITGFAGSGDFGEILSGALESSNVDIAEELTAMIESQRNYTANSKVFQTGSELLEVLVNLKR
ncbi:flagellar hook protein FlgE [Sinorhizobium meliloti WSM1022]|jgi:flagellar hook protein FlgE|uniref:Flagellar hook protein FlgE n=1 Tax=Sinorhizobium meliloti (strain SM11) TaxID=707241 RepID=F7X8H3_SINMM|nr:flagellar hook protein FlgE [Sinorhizobium meliloti]PST28842.1 flagellar hook protein FlgE [Mesorhizobium loti]AEH77601.1 flagellar hook-associated protein [Sinorhizobium meliloti SM11]ARS69645.1 flagellar hook protein FlgE [Sinorhizobium meliloti RU11/001]ASP68205.1 flagellar hook protein FlgE [Sinorhizobium meliloti]ASQ05010.1 flagellar hook protein FlgE [Sinorhizobium meliloti]